MDSWSGPKRYVAEAKRQLYGRVGIDLFAGPTETLVIADETVDGEMCATDLLGRGTWANLPAILLTISENLAKQTMEEVDRQLNTLSTSDTAAPAWRDYGQVIVADSYDEMVEIANDLAFEHVQVMTDRDDWFLENMSNYGCYFSAQGPMFPMGQSDRYQSHPSHPQGRALYRRPLGREIHQNLHLSESADRRATVKIGEYCSRLCELEGLLVIRNRPICVCEDTVKRPRE